MFLYKGNKKQIPIIKEFYALGTINCLQVYGKKGEKAIEEAMMKVNDIDDKMSVFKEHSDISRINKNSGVLPQEVSEDTFYVIKKAIEYSKLSQGAIDVTIRPIVALWGINTDHARIPSKDEIKEKLKLVNYKDIILNECNCSIKLNQEKQAIDVGGIAKGFAADEVNKVFRKHKIKSAMIDLGGNIVALGKKVDGTPWRIGIQDPLSSRGEYVGVVSVENKSVVTSGNYERYFIKNNKRFHHIIDPRTGTPSESGIISATIISDQSIDGDALTTCAYIMGVEKALELIEHTEGVDAIFITENKEIYVTAGIKDNFELINEEYSYIKNMHKGRR